MKTKIQLVKQISKTENIRSATPGARAVKSEVSGIDGVQISLNARARSQLPLQRLHM